MLFIFSIAITACSMKYTEYTLLCGVFPLGSLLLQDGFFVVIN